MPAQGVFLRFSLVFPLSFFCGACIVFSATDQQGKKQPPKNCWRPRGEKPQGTDPAAAEGRYSRKAGTEPGSPPG